MHEPKKNQQKQSNKTTTREKKITITMYKRPVDPKENTKYIKCICK